MKVNNLENEVRDFLAEWNRAILEKDVVAAAQLREDGYSATLPGGRVLTKEEEIVVLASSGYTIKSINIENVIVRGRGNTATAFFDNLIEGEYTGTPIKALYKSTISCRRTNGQWRAKRSSMVSEEKGWHEITRDASGSSRAAFGLGRLIPKTVRSYVKGAIKSVVSEAAPSFQELAIVPYRPGIDFVIPPHRDNGSGVVGADLPIPPQELWLGYNYPAHGKAHVSKMLEIVYASDFSFKKNDRILDLGCGAGRMIRHFQELSETCEIWGTDISAEHIYWCKQHLSPPFNFATTTKIPHLPFEDRSFQFIYCGSVFTHIDDLADAWLLELRRILSPGGRLYLTIHDTHTIELFEGGGYDHAEIVSRTKSREIYQKSKHSFGMFTAGRDNNSQVFYDTDYFSKILRPMFDLISVTPEAYFYQTAFLLKR